MRTITEKDSLDEGTIVNEGVKIMKKILTIIMIIVGTIMLAGTTIIRLNFYNKAASSIAIIGGADGPTSIFIAGKIGTGSIGAAVIGIILIVAAILLMKRK